MFAHEHSKFVPFQTGSMFLLLAVTTKPVLSSKGGRE